MRRNATFFGCSCAAQSHTGQPRSKMIFHSPDFSRRQIEVYVPTRLPAAFMTGPVVNASVPPSCTSTISGAQENGACGASKNFCQFASTSAGPRSGLVGEPDDVGRDHADELASTSRSASVFANAISVARTCSASVARVSAATGDGATTASTNKSRQRNSWASPYMRMRRDTTFGAGAPLPAGGTMASTHRIRGADIHHG